MKASAIHGAVAVSERAGRYVVQPGPYRAFVPAALPPDPPVAVSGSLQRLLSQADLALGRLDGSVAILPNPDLFVMMYVRKEAVLSSQIEGTQSSLQDLLAAEAHVFGESAPRDVDEVVNYVSAMNHGLRRLSEFPVSVRLIREIHAKLLTGTRGERLTPGDLRTRQNWIGNGSCPIEQATFVPPPPAAVPDALRDLETFLNADDDLPTLIKIGLAHVQFETIHPFLDGNGRIGRLMMTFLLVHAGVLSKPVLYLSAYLKQHRSRYYELLQDVRDHGAWEPWLEFYLRGVCEVSVQAAETARQIVVQRESARTKIADELGRAAGNGYRVLEQLYATPIISVKDVETLLDVTYPAANQLVERLRQIGILREMTGRARHRRFRYDAYVRLFA